MGQTTFCNSTWPWRALFLNPPCLIPCSYRLPAQGIPMADPNARVFSLPHHACHVFQICPAFEKLSSLFSKVVVNLCRSFTGLLSALHPARPFWSPSLALFCLIRALLTPLPLSMHLLLYLFLQLRHGLKCLLRFFLIWLLHFAPGPV